MSSPPPGPPTYWAFVSYSSHDRAWAKWLQKAVETYAIPRRLVGYATPAGPAPSRLRPLFRDRSELAADPDLEARVGEALEQSAFLIVVCSPAAAASRWVDAEIRRFRELHGESRILAVIVAGNPHEGHEDCFPPALRYRDEDGKRIRAEPIAADLRRGGDGRRLVRLKLIAGMLGVGLDELVHRDAQRRARQFTALTVAGFAGMTVMAALAGAAILARNEAQRQRAQAEGLIGFMLTDLRKRLEPSGRLELMDVIGKKALAYYAVQRPEDLDAGSLGQRARALTLMGEISLQRGHLVDALDGFEAASATTAELMARAPTDGKRIFDHAQNVYWVGNVAYQRGEEGRAEAAFRTYGTLARRLSALDPDRDDWRMESVYAESALGALYLDEGRAPEAAAAFARALAVAQTQARKHPADAQQALDLGQCHGWLADALEAEGQLAAARAHRVAELDIDRELLARDATLQDAKFATIVATRALARLDVLSGDMTVALGAYTEAARKAETLLIIQPDNMDLAGEVAAAEIDLGETLLAANRPREASVHRERVTALAAEALAHDSTVKDWQAYRARAALLQAALAARGGDKAGALRLDLSTLAGLEANPPVGVNTESRWLIDRARVQTGDDFAALGRAADARRQWSAAADDLSGPLDRYEPRLLTLLEGADRRLGRAVAARTAGMRLAALHPPATR